MTKQPNRYTIRSKTTRTVLARGLTPMQVEEFMTLQGLKYAYAERENSPPATFKLVRGLRWYKQGVTSAH